MVNTRSVRAGNQAQPLGQGQGQYPNNLPPHLPPQIPNLFPPIKHAEGGDENQPHNSAHNSASTHNQGDVVIAQLAAMQQQFSVFHLEKLVAEQRGAPPSQRNTDSIPHPLNTNITLEPYPVGFKILQLETYDGTKDSDDHFHAFYSYMQAQNASDALMCKISPSILRVNARTWYYSLPLKSISFYTEIASAFATKFSNRRLIRKITSKLMRVKQREGESLKNYMSQFNDTVLEINSFNQAVGITAVIQGLQHERFRDSLIKYPAATFNEINNRSLKFITVEEYALSQKPILSKIQNLDWRDEGQSRKQIKTVQNRGPMSTSTSRFRKPNSVPPQQITNKAPRTWTPFNLSRSQIFMQIKNKMDLRRPRPMRSSAATRDHTRYCDFHQDHAHTTEECNSLRSELESLAQKGMLNEYIQRTEQPKFIRGQGPQLQRSHNAGNRQGVGYQQAPPPLPPLARIIHMITEGLEVGGLSSKQRKLYVRERYDGPIYGFNNQPVQVEGVLTLNIAFGSDRTYVTLSIRFLIVKMTSFFNAVIGRPTLTKIQAVVMGVEIVDNRPKDETRATLVEDVEEVQIDDKDQNRKTQIGTRLNPKEIVELIAFLRANKDVFAWISIDMLGIPTLVSQHKLSTNPLKKPVAQKRRLFGGGEASVLVKKVNGKWRMCIDYTNLNQARPKYCYPMPSIDKLVEAAFGNERLSLLHAYSGYHQVPMAPKDEEKTSFYAGDEIYCHVMMPFGLKNAGATYQKMVTIVFRAQIGRNLKVYVDDIVVKSPKVEDHLVDLDETFNNLRKNRMRLNPTKCIFGVESRKFLGFMVSRRGIEANPERIKVIAKMEPPKSVKDIHKLTGRVAALHRFISKTANKCLPFFKIMRSAAQKDEFGKQKKFEWNTKCQVAFNELKSYLSSPPLLKKAIDGEILYLYLGISDEAISSILVREEASNSKGLRAGALLVGPDRYQSEHALKFNFDATNNMAKYEALLLGLQLTVELKVMAIQVYSASQLVVNQINSVCEIVNSVMMKYVALVAELKCKFQKFCLCKIPQTENKQANSLSKFTSNSSLSSRSIFVDVLNEPSFMKPRMMEISTDLNTLNWTDPIVSFLQDRLVPKDKQEDMRLRKKASRYTLVDGVLYKRSFSLPLLRCLNPYEAEYAL
ncbi:hypothetical protein SLEP1_g53349 [Rubroshorea leprosula]|uniref:Uncharacterized protein n=1 Tax=Rubroshorea leprosula TaxID=152421 RepID=A0AAV5MAY2_9ROSI|nr:hypothetical protein SLEP1_g53349 [Rubroshorea leprosula]